MLFAVGALIRDVSVAGVQTCALPMSVSVLIPVNATVFVVRFPEFALLIVQVSFELFSVPVPPPATVLMRSEERRVGDEWTAFGALIVNVSHEETSLPLAPPSTVVMPV